MIKKTVLAFVVLSVLVGGVSWSVFSITPWSIKESIQIATGLAAKLACSAHFLSGFAEDKVRSDLVTYSPVFAKTEFQFKDQQVRADLFGLAQASATFRQGLGCSLDIGDTAELRAYESSQSKLATLPWPQGSQVLTVKSSMQSSLDELMLQDKRDGYDTRALVVVHGGQIIGESYADGIDANTPLLGWSMAKSVTSILLGHLEYLGLITVDEQNLFTAWKGSERSKIRLENLLHMTSGLAFDDSFIPPSDVTRMLFDEESASAYAVRSTSELQPGKKFSYSSGTTNLLVKFIAERLKREGQDFYPFIRKNILEPLALRHTYLEPDASGSFVGSSYLYASARDWARFGLLMLSDGELNGKRILNSAWVEKASAPNNSQNDPRYGYQFWLNAGSDKLRWHDLPKDAYAMMGNRGQRVMIFPSKDLVIVRLGWSVSRYPTSARFKTIISQLDSLRL